MHDNLSTNPCLEILEQMESIQRVKRGQPRQPRPDELRYNAELAAMSPCQVSVAALRCMHAA